MAEVLTEHAFHMITPVTLGDVNGPWQVECNCTADPIQGPSFLGAEQAFAAHQADALTEAGYGPVQDAGAQALRDAAELIEANRPEMGPGINITQYREGRDDAFARASVICTRYAESLVTP